MPIKQKGPLAIGTIAAVAVAAALLLLRPPAADLLKAAALQYSHGLGAPVREWRLHGNVAEYVIEPHGQRAFVEFAQREGAFSFSRDLVADFDRHIAGVEREVVGRLARRIGERHNITVKMNSGISRVSNVESEGERVLGRCVLAFEYTTLPGSPPGRYVETFSYKEGAWISDGMGALFDLPPRK